ncbi:bacteriophage HK97-gp10 putative tail-component [Streptomyces sp. Amel2xB2]|uniref:HK97 gp10 family phage protein n=1 Tax=Streptomyces sp. Amel2xB2 TaxID=1305829 RepID=UPI000DBABCC1|nr:HK97 gp10 family phage protein [Streptomyces sp. Amel2xB2]RAJ70279.1 bacteriophage HK97-gp10 putative tail-component [Streptomyces sp. Amel2xB2]
MTVTFTMRVNPGWQRNLHAEVERYMERLATVIQADAQRMAPVATGRLRGSIYKEASGLTARVGVRGVNYWMAQEYGAGPHIIRPVNKKALAWPGGRHPVAVVNHPGNPARPFLRPALYTRRGAL